VAPRRYGKKSPAISQAGHQERPRDPAGDESLSLPLTGRQEFGKSDATAQPQGEATSEPVQHDAGSLKAQIDTMRRQAEQRQQLQNDPLAHYLASIPGLSPYKFYFLHHYFSQYPDRLNPQHWEILKAAHHIATQERKIQEDGPEYFEFLNQMMHQHAAPPPTHTAPPQPMPDMPPMAHADLEQAEHDHEPQEGGHMAPHNISAPPSRSGEHYVGDYEPRPESVRLSPEEREIAQRTGISEVQYAAGKLKLQKMKKSKLISD
jgi:hypothetical protein